MGKYGDYYVVHYTKVSVMSDTVIKEKVKEYLRLDGLFQTLRFSKHCKRGSGLKFNCCTYSDGSLDPETNEKVHWINEDISIRPIGSSINT